MGANLSKYPCDLCHGLGGHRDYFKPKNWKTCYVCKRRSIVK
jgi:hypothetical protein